MHSMSDAFWKGD